MVTAVLAILVLPEPVGLLYLLPATAGGLAGIRWGRSVALLILAAVLVAATAYLFLISVVGLAYIPSVSFLIAAAALNLKSPKAQQPL